MQLHFKYSKEFKQYFPVSTVVPNKKLQLDFLMSVLNQIPANLLMRTTHWNDLGIEVLEDVVLVYDILLLKYVQDEHEKVLSIPRDNYEAIVAVWDGLVTDKSNYIVVEQDDTGLFALHPKQKLSSQDTQVIQQDKLMYEQEMNKGFLSSVFWKVKNTVRKWF